MNKTLLAVALMGLLGAVGCHRNTRDDAGDKAEEAVDTAGEKTEDAADATGDAAENAGDKVEDATDPK